MKKICVIGAGTMGSGIAQVFATNNFKVNLFDISKIQLKKANRSIEKSLLKIQAKQEVDKTKEILNRIAIYNKLEDAVCDVDIVIEAATESLEIKRNIFSTLDKICHKNCILATNTSSISITQIAKATNRADKVIGMHFMNPVPLMKLVEVIKGFNTSQQSLDNVQRLCNEIHKTMVTSEDYPGFIANRILMPSINEAIIALHEGVAGVEQIDSIMKLGMGHPMGPLQLADFIGLDVCLSILNVLYEGFKNPKYAPCPLLVNMVRAGKIGVKTSEGFYTYQGNFKNKTVSKRFQLD